MREEGGTTLRTIRADGDTWGVKLGRHRPGPTTRALLFFPVTSDQRPYRVVEIEEDRMRDESELEALSERELRRLFEDSVSMDDPETYS